MRRVRRPLLALVALLVALAVGYAVRGTDGSSGGRAAPSTSSVATGVPLSSLPPQVGRTVRLVEAGGPFPYPHNDGVTFHNNEHRLPAEPDGFYREYTVPTPGSPDRGPRRLIVGRDGRYWYTGDHYESFRRVDVTR